MFAACFQNTVKDHEVVVDLGAIEDFPVGQEDETVGADLHLLTEEDPLAREAAVGDRLDPGTENPWMGGNLAQPPEVQST